ncbi:MAG: hypothetical protein KDI36_06235 [Pseudomonadales bacterium]|nr:hypothetical protein [Pseudomonadales bacterium]
MRFTTDYNAVFKTHQARDHFSPLPSVSLEPHTRHFSVANAWWLSHFSRWIYLDAAQRASQLQRTAGCGPAFREVAHFHHKGMFAALCVAKDNSVAVMTFRGTANNRNWVSSFNCAPLRQGAHRGYDKLLTELWSIASPTLTSLDCPVFFTGHSMGAGLATLAARNFPTQGVYGFGPPPTGTASLRRALAATPVFRLVNYRDLVPRLIMGTEAGAVGETIYFSHHHQLWNNPAARHMRADRRQGERDITRQLNRQYKRPLPEALTDHSPQNYVASLRAVVGHEYQTASTSLLQHTSPELSGGYSGQVASKLVHSLIRATR